MAKAIHQIIGLGSGFLFIGIDKHHPAADSLDHQAHGHMAAHMTSADDPHCLIVYGSSLSLPYYIIII